MAGRLRSRDPRNNSNKCYAIFFESEKMGKSKNRSPPKKRESPKKKIIPNTAAVTVRKDEVEKKYEMVVADDVDGTSDDIKHVVDMKSESFESTSMTTTTTPLTKTQTTTTTTTTSSTESSYCIKRKFSSSAKNTTTSNVTSSTAPIADGAERKILQDGAEETKVDGEVKKFKTSTEKDQMFEHFQPWALKTYGDQAKTKTITYKKKSRILKALDGKEHNNPDSSKFRFWVKSKGFTTKKPESFVDTGNNQDKDTQKDHIDLYVASTTKEFGERAYRKVAVVEQFFDIIYNVHVELGGRGGRHAGQKRTYRIITETYAFLPREAVTKFLTGCPACKKNLRPFSPSRFDEQFTESSSEFEALNYSSQNESSIDSTQLGPIKSIYKIKHENRSRTGTPINKYENISRTGTPVIPTFSESNIETTTTPTTNNNNKVENQDFPKISEIQQNPSTSTANNNLPSSSSSAISIIKSEPVSYFDEIYAKIRNYYKEQGLDNLDINELKSDSNFLNYYQLLKKYCGNSQGQIQQVIPMVTGTTINQNINSKLDCDIKNLSKNFKTPSVTTYFDTKIPQQSDIQISNKNPIFDSSSHSESIDSCIDLRITQSDIKTTVQNPFPHSININIENAVDINDSTDNQYSGNRNNFGNVENSVFINSVDVSINMSNSSNELKISCKTTPPKKRYSVYKPELIETAPKVVTDIVRQPCAMNLIKRFNEPQTSSSCDRIRNVIDINNKKDEELVKPKFQVDLRKVKPITSTYLKMTRSMGLSDEDALKIDDLETLPTSNPETTSDPNPEEAYAGLMKDADKLKLMLLAWNYQNSNAVRNGSEGPDLGVVGGLWAQYQNALALNSKQPSVSPVNRADQSSPIENQDETNSSGQKDEDDGSEDDSDDKLDQNAQDPERLKAFNMFVRLFVDENLDRMIPISKQPKEKIQAIIDSCARQFPEFCERSRKRIRTYLKSCRRNKKAREGWDNSSRPTPAHLTSVQAEQILAIACENESMNAKRMRIGLDPISQSMPMPSSTNVSTDTSAPSISYPGFRSTPTATGSTNNENDVNIPSSTAQTVTPARSSPLGLNTTMSDVKPLSVLANGTTTNQTPSPLYRPADFASPTSTSSPYPSRPQTYPTFFQNSMSGNAAPTDLSMKQQQQHLQPATPAQIPTSASGPVSTGRPPLLSHKLNANEMNAVRQLITGYRESAAFLLRSADELEQLLLQQQ